MKSRMLLSPLWKIGSWKKLLFLCGKKSLEKPTVELWREITESEVLPRLHATVELTGEIIESEVLLRLHATVEPPREIIESEVLPKLHTTVELPRAIIEWQILPRLPAESLCRFMRVCKQWKSHILTREFTMENLEHINKESLTHLKVLRIDDLNNHGSTIVHSIPYVNEARKVLLLASLDGLVFVKVNYINTCESAFWNPLTGAYTKLSNYPKYYSPFDALGLYFDSNKKDYRVLQFRCVDGALKAHLFSQRLNSTKDIQWFANHPRLYCLLWSTPISFGESLYFVGKGFGVGYGYQFSVIVFHVKSEKFREILFPLLNQENPYYYASLMVIKGCIHICVTRCRCMKVGGELWRMDGDGDSWTKVKDFPPASNHPWTYDEKIIDMEDLALDFNCRERGRKVLYLETLVSPVRC